MKRRDEKLCFQCGGPFGTGPRFPEKSLRAVILVEDEPINEDGEITRKKTETGTEEDDNEAGVGVRKLVGVETNGRRGWRFGIWR